MKAIVLQLGVSLVLTSACAGMPTSPTAASANGTTPAVTTPAPVASVPAPTPAPAPPPPAQTTQPAACSRQAAPAPGMELLLLCVTSGTAAVEGAEITYAGQYQGVSDSNGQFLLHLRGYGGTQPLVVYHAAYSRSPVHLDLALREDHVAEHVDLGSSLR